MNTYKKFYPNVFIAQCSEKHQKGDVITVVTKYGKVNEHIVHNFIGYTGTNENPLFCYSITRLDGFNSQERAKRKAEKINEWANNAKKRSDKLWEKSNEGKEFLVLAEPIKIGHHSEKRHRALIERNARRMNKSMQELSKVEQYEAKAEYWEGLATKIDLSMPESLEFFEMQLKEAKEYHKGLKDKTIERQHAYSLTYAKKKVNELKKKYDIALKLWS